MSVTTEYVYGAFSSPPFINQYGVTDTPYGVITDPYPSTYSFLLLETGDKLLQEDGSDILLG